MSHKQIRVRKDQLIIMSQINISNLTFGYDGSFENIFENVSFCIDTDWKLGFIGRNGRGKTTFLNLLMGKYAYQGSITASVEFSLFPYSVRHPEADAIDIAEEMNPEYQYWQLAREMNALRLGEDVLYRPFNTLSNGEQTKLLLAVLFLRENNFLLIDEPTNHLDMHGREIVGKYLNSKKGFILVSHDRSLLDGCVDHVISINRSDIEIQQGNFSSWYLNKQRQDAFELAENDKLKKEIRRLKETVREKAQWSARAEARKIGLDPHTTEKSIGRRSYEGAKSKKMMARSKAMEARQQAAIEEKSGLLKNIEKVDALKISQMLYRSGCLAQLRDVSIRYGEREVCSRISFAIERGDRIALRGANGSGKSSILKLLCGEEIPHTGEVHLGSGLRISVVPQDTSFLQGNLSDYAAREQLDESLFKAILRKLDFSRAQFEKNMEDFSAGQKKKVLIAASLSRPSHLLIWDEPLNFVDVLSRMQLEELILRDTPTILFVEHDAEFSARAATRVIRLTPQGRGSFCMDI